MNKDFEILEWSENPVDAILKRELGETGLERLNECVEINMVSLNEGIDIDSRMTTVSFNPNHQNNVDTGSLYEPKPIYDKIGKWDVVSIFKRKANSARPTDKDGNPLVYALKGLYGWKFKNPEKDIYFLFRRFVAISHKIDKHYDTIVVVPSTNKLNNLVMGYLAKIIGCKHQICKLFVKHYAEDVWDRYMDFDRMDKDGLGSDWIRDELWRSFEKMGEYFSYKYIDTKFRKYVIQSMHTPYNNVIDCAPLLNGKSVLVLDDTIATGATVSEVCKTLVDTFDVKKVTVITLFSALHKN